MKNHPYNFSAFRYHRITFVVLVALWLSCHSCIAIAQNDNSRPTPQPTSNDARTTAEADLSANGALLPLVDGATQSQNAGDFAKAARQWEQLLADHPEAPIVVKAHFNAGLCRIKVQDFASAIEHFKQGLARADASDSNQIPQAMLYLGYGQLELGRELIAEGSTGAASDRAQSHLTTATETLGRLLRQFPAFEAADQAAYFQGEAFTALGRYEEAVASLQQMLKYPDPWMKAEGLFQLAAAQEQLGRYDRSLKSWQSLLDDADLATDPTRHALLQEASFRSAKVLLELANADENAGDTAAAAEKYATAFGRLAPLADDRSFALAADARRLQAIAAARSGDHATADKLMNQWSAETGQPLPVDEQAVKANEQLDQALIAFQNGKFPETIQLAEAFGQQFPESPLLADVLDLQADALLSVGKPAEALPIYQQLLDHFSQHSKRAVWTLRSGVARYQLKQYQSAIKTLQPLVQEPSGGDEKPSPQPSPRGRGSNGSGSHTEKLASQAGPAMLAEAWHWIGRSYFQLNEMPPAVDALKQSFAADPTWRRSDENLLLLSQAQTAFGSLQDAVDTVSFMLEQFEESPATVEATFRVAENAYASKKFETAVEHYQIVADKFDQSALVPFAMLGAGWSYDELDNPQESSKWFERLAETFPDHPLTTQSAIARAAQQRSSGDLDGSIETLGNAVSHAADVKTQETGLAELGVSLVEKEDWPAAIEQFEKLLQAFPSSSHADRYHYELAWALRSRAFELSASAANDAEEVQALQDQADEHFLVIAKLFPDSRFAPEADYHVAMSAYEAEDYPGAADHFPKVVEADLPAAVRERAFYRLGWTQYRLGNYDRSAETFAQQLQRFPAGQLAADGKFMFAESQFRQDKHDAALQAYLVAKPAVDADGNVDPRIRVLTMLHGAQSANEAGKFDEAIKLATPVTELDTDEGYVADGWLEIGLAHAGLGNTTAALESWAKAADANLGETGARARCLMGRALADAGELGEALNEFKLVYYGFGGVDAAEAIRPWQAYALYEASRINQMLAADANGSLRNQYLESAITQYDLLLKHYADQSVAESAKDQLERLRSLIRKP